MSSQCVAATSTARIRCQAVALIAICLVSTGGMRAWTSTPVRLAQDGRGQDQESEARDAALRAGRIEGVWDVRVTIRDCQTGNPIRPVRARNMFIRGGTLTEINARATPTPRGVSFGTWRVEDGGTYFATFWFARFNADGTFRETVRVTRRIQLRDANHFVADAAIATFDDDETPGEAGCATEAATRLR